jgi:hypothetical protein
MPRALAGMAIGEAFGQWKRHEYARSTGAPVTSHVRAYAS